MVKMEAQGKPIVCFISWQVRTQHKRRLVATRNKEGNRDQARKASSFSKVRITEMQGSVHVRQPEE